LMSTCLVAPPEPTRDEQDRYDRNKANYLFQSEWNSRGWTFQESLFSRRCLILSQEQVFWECRSASWYEERKLECDPLVRVAWPETRIQFLPLLSINLPTISRFSTIKSTEDRLFDEHLFADVVGRYTKRSLTFDDDALNAIQGVLRVWELYCHTYFLHDLPDHILERSLRWHGSQKRGSGHSFPSRSWLAWSSPISMPRYETHVPLLELFKPELSYSLVSEDPRRLIPVSSSKNARLLSHGFPGYEGNICLTSNQKSSIPWQHLRDSHILFSLLNGHDSKSNTAGRISRAWSTPPRALILRGENIVDEQVI
jgi:hypothetical protein